MKHSCLFIVCSSRTHGTKFVRSFCQYSLNDWWWAILVSLGMEKLYPPFYSRIKYYILWYHLRERGDLIVKSTRKKLLLLFNLRDLIMWCIGADSPWVKKCVLFSFPPMMYGYAHSFLWRSLNSSHISFNTNLVCFENVSFSIFLKVKQNKGVEEVTFLVLRILKYSLHQPSILKLDFRFSPETLCVD